MAQTILWGTGASVTSSGSSFLFNTARVSLRQGVAVAKGFGQRWAVKHGTVCDYSVTVSGVMTSGTSTDNINTGSMFSGTAPAGIGVLVAFSAGCSFYDVMVQSGLDLSTDIDSVGTEGASYEGPTSFTGPTFAWATT